MPDVTMIPAIASFFGISTDELFEFNRYETEKKVEAIVEEHSKYWDTDKAKAEKIIRDGLLVEGGEDVTWFGQLMARPQLVAWLCQFDVFCEEYRVSFV